MYNDSIIMLRLGKTEIAKKLCYKKISKYLAF